MDDPNRFETGLHKLLWRRIARKDNRLLRLSFGGLVSVML